MHVFSLQYIKEIIGNVT